MTDDEKTKYEEDRAKAIEEWSDIELRFKDGPPQFERTESHTESDRLDDNANGTSNARIEHKEDILTNELWRRIFEMNYDTAKAEALKELLDQPSNASTSSYSANPFSGLLFLRQCVCRPSCDDVERVKNDKLREQRVLLVALANTPFSAASIEHWRLLCDFFRKAATSCIGDAAQAGHCPRTGSHWQIVGFQGVDPSTDLRGVGLFGLLQLHYLVSEWGLPEEQLATIIKFSHDEQQQFPFAIVGLNFTSLIVSKIKSGELNGLANVKNSFLEVVNGIYRGCFMAFYRDWKATGKSILDFQFALQKIEKILTRDPNALFNMKWTEERRN